METAPAPGRRLGFLRSAKAFWHPHIALMLPLGFCLGVPVGWIVGFSAMALPLGAESYSGYVLLLLAVSLVLSFIWAPVFDRLPLPRLTGRLGRRRSWMLATHVLCMAALAILEILGPSADLATHLFLGLVVALVSSSIGPVINAYRIELLEKNRYGAGEAVTSLGLSLGTITAIPLMVAAGRADFGGIEDFAALAVFLVGVAIALFGPEPSCAEEKDMAARESRFASTAARWGGAIAAWFSRVFFAPLTEFFTRPAWLAVLAFFLLFKLGSVEAKMADPAESLGGVALFVGFVVGAMAVYARGPLPGLVFAASLLLLSNLALLALDGVPADSIWIGLAFAVREFADGFGTVAAAAYAMCLCRPSYTATQFVLFSSVMAVGEMFPGPRSKLAELLAGGPEGAFLSVTLASLLSLLLLRVLWKRQRPEETRS